MEVRHRQDFASPCGQPRFLGTRLAARAMPVPAGMIDVPTRPAIGAGFEMPAERSRAAGENGPPDLGRAPRQRLAGEIGRTEGGEHLGQTGLIHEALSWASATQAAKSCRSDGIAPDESSAWSY